jgi:hypothetical protein
MPALTVTAARRPNIVLTCAADLGHGDVGCRGATRVRTPNIDEIAAKGPRFADAHARAATSTPSRYPFTSRERTYLEIPEPALVDVRGLSFVTASEAFAAFAISGTESDASFSRTERAASAFIRPAFRPAMTS